MKYHTPPKEIPIDLYDNYTMEGKVPIIFQYCDDTPKEGEQPKKLTKQMYDKTLQRLEDGSFIYYGQEWRAICEALDAYCVKDKIVLIWGLVDVNCDAMALWKGAKHIYVVDYNAPICEHDKITVITHEELNKDPIYADIAISYSSFEHDGLGRYGDPLNPDGDLLAMKDAHKYLKENGLLIFGVPVGQDCLGWNGCRFYGPLRLPKMLRGWKVLDVFNAHSELTENYPFDMPLGSILQFCIILQKIPTEYPEDIYFEDTIEKLHNNTIKTGTNSPQILLRILKMVYENKSLGVSS